MKQAIIIGTCLICASTIISADKIYNLYQSSNSISLTSGKVKLGEVYSERLTTTFNVILNDSQESFMNIETNTDDLFQVADDDFSSMIKSVNKEKKKEELLNKESATWNRDATITITTVVTYKSQYQPSFDLTIDETIIKYVAVKEGAKAINSYIQDLKEYSSKMNTKYELNNSFI